jgi:glutathione S-transferase/RNA polymerase-associated protein
MIPIVYEHPLSPYAQKVKLALEEKGIAFTTRNLSALTDAHAEDFFASSPRGEVPLLVDNGFAVFDSTIILEYIEDRWPDPPLLPVTATDRARVRMLEEVMDTHFEANTWGLSEVKHFRRAEGALASTLNQFAASELQQWFGWLDHHLGEDQWFNGDGFGWADLCVVPFVNGACRFDIQPRRGSALSAWLTRVNEVPSVIRCKQQADAAELDADLMTQAIENGFKREYRDHRLEWMLRAGGVSIVREGLDHDNIRFNTPFPSV